MVTAALLYHLMVDLRLGWLTVLSSRKIVEQELNFRVNVPWKKKKKMLHNCNYWQLQFSKKKSDSNNVLKELCQEI